MGSVNCSSVYIKDMEVCGDMGSSGAHCAHTQKTDTRDIPLAAWNVERFGQLCIKGDDFGEIKLVIEKLCHQTKHCTSDMIKSLNVLEGIHQKIMSIK